LDARLVSSPEVYLTERCEEQRVALRG